MLKNLPIKKNYILIAGIVLFLMISYQLSFRKTVEAWILHRQLTGQVAKANNLDYQPGYLERKSTNLDNILNLYKADTSLLRSNIISTITLVAEKQNVKLIEVPTQDAFYHTDKFIIQKLNFEGNFFDLNKFLNQLHSLDQIGMIRSVDFKLITPGSGAENEKKLTMQIYLELSTGKG